MRPKTDRIALPSVYVFRPPVTSIPDSSVTIRTSIKNTISKNTGTATMVPERPSAYGTYCDGTALVSVTAIFLAPT